MASDNPRDHNNQDFQLTELFGVKDKVALITGKETVHRVCQDHDLIIF